MACYNKAVRDRIPEIIEESGGRAIVEILDRKAFLESLEAKLQEEAREYLESQDLEELADIVEVVRAILDRRGVSWDALEEVRKRKVDERGAFSRSLFLISVEQVDCIAREGANH